MGTRASNIDPQLSSDRPAISDQWRRNSETLPRRSKFFQSRKFNRGAIGGLVDGRSVTGKWIRRLEAELIAHLGHPPSIVEQLLIERLVRVRLQLESFDQRIANGELLSPHDGRVYGALMNSLRLTCREIGLKGAAAKVPSLSDLFPGRDAA
jgi:hypothetical protein